MKIWTTSLMAQANVTTSDVQLLTAARDVLSQGYPTPINSFLSDQKSALLDLCQRIERAGGFFNQQNPLRLLTGSVDDALRDHKALEAVDAALKLCITLFQEVGYAAASAVIHGVSGVNTLGFGRSCMSLEMIRCLVAEGGLERASAIRSGAGISQRPIFFVTPPGTGFGEWFGMQKFSQDAHGKIKHPRQALEEWGHYVDRLSEFADVFAIPYVSDRDSSLWRMVYAANGPQIFEVDGELYAVLPNLSHLGRQGEHRWFQEFLLQLGMKLEHIIQAQMFQEGQADFARPIARLGQKPLLFLGYGIRTPKAEVYDQFRNVHITYKDGTSRDVDLLSSYQLEPVRMNPNSYAFHQDTWLNVIYNKNGEVRVLYCPEWIHPDDRDRFAGILAENNIPAIVMSDADAKAYAANANEVSGNIFLVRGGDYEVSEDLRRELTEAQFDIIELNCDELYAKAGGGTRCMVNELRGINRANHREFLARLEFFRYEPGSWNHIAHIYPEEFDPAQANARRRFVITE